MRRRGTVIGAAVLVVATAGFGLYRAVAGGAGSARSAAVALPSVAAGSTPSASPSASPTPAPADPLTIAAMRARAYPASTLVPVRSDGEKGGYVNTVVSFQSDGLTEYALMSVPDTARPAAGWPVVVINHGYIDPASYVTDGPDYAEFIAAYARAGYVVLKPDYRGNGHSQGVPEGGHLSPVYAYDLLNLVSTLRADPRIDPSRIGLYGHSMGGDEVLRAMVVSKDIKAVVFMAGVVGSFQDIFFNWPHPSTTPTPPPVAVQVQVGTAVVAAHGTPTQDPSFWDSASAINYVDFTTAAVQINQDVDDSMVPKLFSDHLAAALQAAGKSVQYITYPGDDHQFIRNRAAILANSVAFFRAHL
jgi:dipeptidyl aminopeptidase/acylaminoacyl peptidase